MERQAAVPHVLELHAAGVAVVGAAVVGVAVVGEVAVDKQRLRILIDLNRLYPMLEDKELVRPMTPVIVIDLYVVGILPVTGPTKVIARENESSYDLIILSYHAGTCE